MYLKRIAIAGLLLDDMPCIEIWQTDKLVFSSHAEATGAITDIVGSCHWNTDLGDGYYKVGEDLLGDFSIICRFGGEHVKQRDKSTLIFKYQNNTGTIIHSTLYEHFI